MRRNVAAISNSLGLYSRLTIALVLLAFFVQWISYQVSSELHTNTLRQREADKIDTISSIIVPQFKRESERVRLIVQLALANGRLVDAMPSKGTARSAALSAIISDIYRNTRIDLFEVTDAEGLVLYRAHEPDHSGDPAPGWGVAEALEGKGSIVSIKGPKGPFIVSVEPISDGKRVIGTVSAGTAINSNFVARLSAEVGAELALISRSGNMTTASSPALHAPDAIAVREAFQQKIPIYRNDDANQKTLVYLPVLIVDDAWVVLVSLDSSSAFALLRKGNEQAAFFMLLVVLGSVLVTFIVVWSALKPLRALRVRADKIVTDMTGHKGDHSGQDDIASLVKSLDTLTHLLLERNQTLKVSEVRYRTIIEASPVPHALNDALGNISYLNTAFVGNFGYTLDDIPTLEDWWPKAYPDSEYRLSVATTWKMHLEHSIREHTKFAPLEINICCKDGTIKTVVAVATQLDALVEETHLVTLYDITDRKRAETARALLEEQLREAQKIQAIGTLAGGIAHDFNNIIATILGNAQLAREDLGNANPGAQESLEEIRKAGTRARELVRQILAFSRREPTHYDRIALRPVVEESARLLRSTLPARLALEVQCEAALPEVLADANQIQQVLINLVTNAMQALSGKTGRVVMRVDTLMPDAAPASAQPALLRLHEKHPGLMVRLAVIDDGPGMDADTLARIFEPFFTTKPVNEGTGLGLSVVHGIVQGHQGVIEVESSPGKGSTFTIYLPAATSDPAQTDARQRAASRTTAFPAPAPTPGNGHQILYVDDDEALVSLVQRLLERRGFRVSGFIDQRAALTALSAAPGAFDLMLTDYNMPGMSGLDVAREARTIRPDLPVAIASGFIDETLRAQAKGAGARELIFKADAVEEFCETVQRLVQNVGTRSETT